MRHLRLYSILFFSTVLLVACIDEGWHESSDEDSLSTSVAVTNTTPSDTSVASLDPIEVIEETPLVEPSPSELYLTKFTSGGTERRPGISAAGIRR